MDRQTDIGRQQRPRLRIALRGKMVIICNTALKYLQKAIIYTTEYILFSYQQYYITLQSCYNNVSTSIWSWFDLHLTAIQLQFDHATTILHYGLPVPGAALLPK